MRYAATGEGAAAAAHCDTMHGSLDTCCYRRGVSEPVGAVTPAGSCCFWLDELPRIVLRLGNCVKCYLTPLAIGAVLLCGFYLTPLAIEAHSFGRFVNHIVFGRRCDVLARLLPDRRGRRGLRRRCRRAIVRLYDGPTAMHDQRYEHGALLWRL